MEFILAFGSRACLSAETAGRYRTWRLLMWMLMMRSLNPPEAYLV